MIRTQQSEDQIEGFFKPIIKVINFTQEKDHLHIQNKIFSDANNLIQKSLPLDYKAKIMNIFQCHNPYPQKLLSDNCIQTKQQLIPLLTNKQKHHKKYVTLEQKYKNNQNYQLIYSKIIKDRQFGSYIFSLDNYSQYHKSNFLTAFQSQSDKLNKKQSSIKFDSNFQSGNLLYAYEKLQQNSIPQYDLIIQNDTNTKGYNQWFYFSVKNIDLNNNRTIKINIVNFIKKHLMFEDGVRPVAFFQHQNQWKFIGREVQYKKSYIKRYIEFNGTAITKNYYTLSFLLDFPQQINSTNNTVYIALNYPYPYKRMINFIEKLVNQNSQPEQTNIKKQTLCYSISHNQVPFLKISSIVTQKQIQKYKKTKFKKNINNEQDQQQYNNDYFEQQIQRKKKKIIILGRQHPGQSVGSFVLEKFLSKLILTSSQSNLHLLKQYSIYVFPMINVDGVIYGNFRTNLAGFDLNRQWIQPNRWLTPQIYHLKKYLSNLQNIQFVLDFHGHSRKLNSFIYACCNPVPVLVQDQNEKNYPDISMFRIYPYILSKQQNLFSIKNCTYSISRDKIKTARLNMFKFLNYNPFIFTFQTGFYGYTKDNKSYRYRIDDFVNIGNGALESLKIVLLKPKKVKEIIKEIKAKDYLFDKWAFQNKQDPGSESNPSEDQLNPIQIKNKVFSEKKMNQNQKMLKKMEKYQKQQKIKNKIKQRKQKNSKKTENYSQTIKIVDKPPIKQKQTPTPNSNKEFKLNFTSKKKDRFKPLLTQSIDKKNLDEANNTNFIKNDNKITKKPIQNITQQIKVPDYIISTKRNRKFDQFKSSSNLLGTGISYFQQQQQQQPNQPNIATQNLKQNIPSPIGHLQINNLSRQDRIQSFSSAFQYQSNRNHNRKFNNSFVQQTQTQKLKSIQEKNKKQSKKPYNHQQKLFIVRQNKIVKMVDSANKKKIIKNQSFLEEQLSQRRQTLRQCQQIMSLDHKCLLNQIKQQQNQDRRKKPIFLNPLTH